MTYPSDETLETTYNTTGNKVKEVAYNASNELVKQTEWVYDSMKRVTQIKELRTLQGVTDEALTTYTYSAFGDLITVQDPSGFSVTYSYDSMGNKTKTSYANEHEIDYTYTLSGQLKEKSYSSKSSDPFNLFTVREIYTYTKDGKLQTKVDNPPVSESENKKTETYRYTNGLLSEKTVTISSKVGLSEQIHELDRVTYTYNSYGQVLVMKDLEGQTENHYTVNGQLSDVTRIKQDVTLNTSFSETNRVEVSRDVIRYEMNLWGNQTKLVYPDASTVTKTYDALNRLLTVSDTTGTTSYTYTTADRKVIETRPNGDIKTTITEWGKVTSLISTHYDAMLETDVVFFEQSLTYDEAGNVVHEVRKQNDVITTIDNTYNARGELTQSTQVSGLNKIVYQYLISPYGNKSEAITRYYDDEFILSESKAYVYNHLNQLESSTIDGITLEYEYDDFGNLIEEGNGSYTKTYAYDLNNRLREVVEGPQTLQFTYDGNGNRLSKSIGSTVVQYVNDTTIENEQVLSYTVETDVTNITYGLNRLNEDGVGYLSDSYGNIIQHGSETYAYTPYGELTQGIINGVNEAGYKGEVHDTSSLQYLRARTYNTQLKQFLQEDTYVGKESHPLSQNRYAFVLNNPFKYSDPSGHISLPYLMEDRGGPIVNYKSPTPTINVPTVQKKQASGPTSLQTNAKTIMAYQQAEVEQIKIIHESTQHVQYKQYLESLSHAPLHDDVGALQEKLEAKVQAETELSKKGFSEQTANNQNPYTYVEVTPTIKSDVSDMLLSVCEMVKSTAIQFTKEPGTVIHNILLIPEKVLINDISSIIQGVGDIGQAITYAKDGDYEAAGKEVLSGFAEFIGGTTSLALIASILLIPVNPVAAAMVAKAALYGAVVETGLGSTQIVVGKTTNDSDYTKEGILHLIMGGLKIFGAKSTVKLAETKIAQNNALKILEQETAQQARLLESVDDIVSEGGLESSQKLLNVGTKSDAIAGVKNLPEAIQSKVKDFYRGGSNAYNNFGVEQLESGNYLVQMTKPGNVPGSYAIYFKEITEVGETVITYKNTIDPFGNLVHTKIK